jgi:hypothetical protein
MIIGSCDPAPNNHGTNWFNPKTGKAIFEEFDFAVFDGWKHKLKSKHIPELALKWVKAHDSYFKHTSHFFIEEMVVPLFASSGRSGKREGCNPLAKDVIAAIHTAILALYPHVKVVQTRPQKIRKIFGIGADRTRKGKSKASSGVKHKAGKRRSILEGLPQITSKEVVTQYRKRIRWEYDRKEREDAGEAALIGVGGYHYYRDGDGDPPKRVCRRTQNLIDMTYQLLPGILEDGAL